MSAKAFAAIAPKGWIYHETVRYRARDARTAMGRILMGMKFHGVVIETPEHGWAYAREQGYRIEKVRLERIAP